MGGIINCRCIGFDSYRCCHRRISGGGGENDANMRRWI